MFANEWKLNRSKLDDTLDRTRATIIKLMARQFCQENRARVLFNQEHTCRLLVMDKWCVSLVEHAIKHVNTTNKKIDVVVSANKEGLTFINTTYRNTDNEVFEIFNHWALKTGHTKTKPTVQRLQIIRALLKDGYSVTDLKTGVNGIMMSDWHTGKHPRTNGRTYTSLNHVFGDSMKLDGFINHARHMNTGEGKSNSMSEYDKAMADNRRRQRGRK